MGIEVIAIIGAVTSIVSTLVGTAYTLFSEKMKTREENSNQKMIIKIKNGTEVIIPLNSSKEKIDEMLKSLGELDVDSVQFITIKEK